MKKKVYLPIAGALLVSVGMLVATGIEHNLMQGVFGAILMAAGAWCLNRADAMEKAEQAEKFAKRGNVKNYRKAA